MKKLSLLTVVLFTFFVSQAQSDSITVQNKQKSFIASVRTLDGKTIKGRLSVVNDSELVLTKAYTYFSNQYEVSPRQYVPAENIRSFSLIRKNSLLKGALIGLGAGAFTGMCIGWISGDDPYKPGFSGIFSMSAREKAALYGEASGVGGAIVGTIIGAAVKTKFTINGKKEKLHDLQPKIRIKLAKNDPNQKI